MIRVLIADDQALARRWIRVLLERAGDMEIVGEARDGLEAVGLARDLNPDIVTMDLRMPHLDGLGATQQIVASGTPTRVIIVTSASEESIRERAWRSGAKQMISKQQAFEDLIPAIRSVFRDDEPISQPTAQGRAMRNKRPRDSNTGVRMEG